MAEVKFDNSAVKAFYEQTCKLGGKEDKIDTAKERNTLAEYLANNAENMSDDDIKTLDSFTKTTDRTGVKEENKTNVGNVHGHGNNITVVGNIYGGVTGNAAIGGDNGQNKQ